MPPPENVVLSKELADARAEIEHLKIRLGETTAKLNAERRVNTALKTANDNLQARIKKSIEEYRKLRGR